MGNYQCSFAAYRCPSCGFICPNNKSNYWCNHKENHNCYERVREQNRQRERERERERQREIQRERERERERERQREIQRERERQERIERQKLKVEELKKNALTLVFIVIFVFLAFLVFNLIISPLVGVMYSFCLTSVIWIQSAMITIIYLPINILTGLVSCITFCGSSLVWLGSSIISAIITFISGLVFFLTTSIASLVTLTGTFLAWLATILISGLTFIFMAIASSFYSLLVFVGSSLFGLASSLITVAIFGLKSVAILITSYILPTLLYLLGILTTLASSITFALGLFTSIQLLAEVISWITQIVALSLLSSMKMAKGLIMLSMQEVNKLSIFFISNALFVVKSIFAPIQKLWQSFEEMKKRRLDKLVANYQTELMQPNLDSVKEDVFAEERFVIENEMKQNVFLKTNVLPRNFAKHIKSKLLQKDFSFQRAGITKYQKHFLMVLFCLGFMILICFGLDLSPLNSFACSFLVLIMLSLLLNLRFNATDLANMISKLSKSSPRNQVKEYLQKDYASLHHAMDNYPLNEWFEKALTTKILIHPASIQANELTIEVFLDSLSELAQKKRILFLWKVAEFQSSDNISLTRINDLLSFAKQSPQKLFSIFLNKKFSKDKKLSKIGMKYLSHSYFTKHKISPREKTYFLPCFQKLSSLKLCHSTLDLIVDASTCCKKDFEVFAHYAVSKSLKDDDIISLFNITAPHGKTLLTAWIDALEMREFCSKTPSNVFDVSGLGSTPSRYRTSLNCTNTMSICLTIQYKTCFWRLSVLII